MPSESPEKISFGKCEGVREVVFVFLVSYLVKVKYWMRQGIRNIIEFLI